MLINGTTASYLGYAHEDTGDVVGGLMTVYLVSTAWMTVRRREGETGLFERGAFLFAATGAVIGLIVTWQAARAGTAIFGGLPGYLFSGVVALAATFDFRMILRGGVSGRQRIVRHLWRMHLGLFIAIGSFFPGQIQLFPEVVRNTEFRFLLFLPALSILVLMLFWLVRVLFTATHAWKPRPLQGGETGVSAAASLKREDFRDIPPCLGGGAGSSAGSSSPENISVRR